MADNKFFVYEELKVRVLFIQLILILFILIIKLSFIQAHVTFYVYPSGNDSWSDLKETITKEDSPFTKLPAAFEMVRRNFQESDYETEF